VCGELKGQAARKWREDEQRRSHLVIIGRNLDEGALREGFRACRLSPQELARDRQEAAAEALRRERESSSSSCGTRAESPQEQQRDREDALRREAREMGRGGEGARSGDTSSPPSAFTPPVQMQGGVPLASVAQGGAGGVSRP